MNVSLNHGQKTFLQWVKVLRPKVLLRLQLKTGLLHHHHCLRGQEILQKNQLEECEEPENGEKHDKTFSGHDISIPLTNSQQL